RDRAKSTTVSRSEASVLSACFTRRPAPAGGFLVGTSRSTTAVSLLAVCMAGLPMVASRVSCKSYRADEGFKGGLLLGDQIRRPLHLEKPGPLSSQHHHAEDALLATRRFRAGQVHVLRGDAVNRDLPRLPLEL